MDPREAMTAERWRRVEELLDAALDRPAAERDAWLRDACGADDPLYRQVARLLAAVDEPNAMLDASGARSFGGLVAEVERQAARAAPPERVGPWRVVAPAGEGGMGTVYIVERDDGQYRMRAALKVVRHGLHHDASFIKRFREERQILARLDHPNVARLLDGGVTEDGRPYYVMELVDGAPIDRWCDDRQLPIEARLALFAKVCDAAAAAHAREIVHRDLKPSNVLVTEQGEPKLLDFGIAKTLAPLWRTAEWAASADDGHAPRSTLTRTGERLLTPEYASPEQIRGESVRPATDVYALGVLLYELLTGRRPYHGRDRSRHEIERAILEEAPTRPSAVATRPGNVTRASDGQQVVGLPSSSGEELARRRGLSPNDLRRRLRGDLDTIVLSALRKEPDRRYRTAAELAADVRRHLDGHVVHARGDSLAYRARVWTARHRRTAIAAALGMVVGGVALGVAVQRAGTAATVDWAAAGLQEDVSTSSPLARRYYADGLRAHARGNWDDATRLFRAALGEDSTLAIAAAYGADAASRDEDYPVANTLVEQTLRHASRATDRERYIALATLEWRLRSSRVGAYADSLAKRAPSTAASLLWQGRAAFMAGDWTAAADAFRRAIAADSAARARDLVPCYACQARADLVSAHMYADSLELAEREAREVTALQPSAASAWQMLALVQLYRGVPDDSAARRRIELYPSDADYAVEAIANRHLRAGNFQAADQLLRGRLETAPPGREERALGWLVTSLRMQERWTEALELARRFRVVEQTSGPPDAAHPAAVPEAQVLLESGRPREAAALYDSVSRWPIGETYTNRVWNLAHMAGALAAAGDTAELRAVIDTLRAASGSSGYGRDARLHHHAEGLLLAARGRDAEAVEAFRRAIFSWNMGYTRTNYELARALLRLGRAEEAVAALQPALRGSLEVNNSYITHTTLHRLLAEAWRAVGHADSARAHEQHVRAATRR